MTEESLKELFTNLKSAPAETNVAEVAQWIGTASSVAGGTTIIQKLLQKKLIIMTSIITSTIIGTIIFFSTNNNKKEENKVIPIIEKETPATILKPTPLILKNTNIEKVLPLTQPTIIDSPAAVNLNTAQKEEAQMIAETPKVNILDTIKVPQRIEDYTSTGSWKSFNDSLHVDTVFNGVKALVFKSSYINDKIAVNGSNRKNVAMNFNYKYKIKGIYTRKNRE
jgi:hypothetical protein